MTSEGTQWRGALCLLSRMGCRRPVCLSVRLGLVAIFRLVKPRGSERNVSQLAPSQVRGNGASEGRKALWNWGNFDAMEERLGGREGASISKMSRCQRAGERFGGYGVLARTAYKLMGAFRGSLAWVKNGVGVAESLFPLSSSSSLRHRFIEFHPEGKRDEGKSPENGSGGFPPKIGNRSPSARASREADRFVDLASPTRFPLSSLQ